MSIPEEAVEALAKRNFESEQGDGEWEYLPEPIKPGWIKEARAQADSLAPFVAAKALEDAAAAILTNDPLDFWAQHLPEGLGFQEAMSLWLRAHAATHRSTP